MVGGPKVRVGSSRPDRSSIRQLKGSQDMTKQAMIATAVSIFAASSFVAASANAQVKCSGTNACKGQSACKGGASACKGQNACKGQGFSDTRDVVSCSNQGGKAVTQ